MQRYIGRIDDRYFEFSTVVDAPVTYLMTRKEYEAYYRSEYGNSAMDALAERLERADAKGTSSMVDDSFEEMISCNRYGDGESRLSVEEFKSRIKQETEANAANRFRSDPCVEVAVEPMFYCPQCLEDSTADELRQNEGYCRLCCQRNQQDLDKHNAEFGQWDRMSDAQREAAIRSSR